eukprot:TRINITY_DN63922_c0_g1_i1.p1 TRINITY_DN63922_c0_g1~~TRINITY_DN63922_c0_g1_i1.p1  ORF type:complete len:522 (-),score=115.26 TRINITY_DN63922_c0_g1_i1:79-1644(-)
MATGGVTAMGEGAALESPATAPVEPVSAAVLPAEAAANVTEPLIAPSAREPAVETATAGGHQTGSKREGAEPETMPAFKNRRRRDGSGNLKIPPRAHAVLRDTEGFQKVFHLIPGGKDIRMGRFPPIRVDDLLAVPYGATLRFVDGEWVRRRPCNVEEVSDALGGNVADAVGDVVEDNRHFAQDGSAQTLQQEEIRQLKQRCSGDEVVKTIAAQSSTFASKTKFAQEKYIKKKQQKHVRQVTVLRPTVMELCETYLKTARSRVSSLRFDYLSSALCHAHIVPGGRYLVLDCAMGLVAGAMAKQLAGNGHVFRVFAGGCSDKALLEMDLGDARTTVRQLPLEVIGSPNPFDMEWVRMPTEDQKRAKEQPEDEQGWFVGKLRRAQKRREDLEAFLFGGGLDAVLIVAGDDEAAQSAQVADLGMQRLVAGGRLVVLGQTLQPLAARQGLLRSGQAGEWVDVRLHQLFTREYQVLPQRTHPHMAQDVLHCEGFILMATRVMEPVEARAMGPAEQPSAPRTTEPRP